MKYAYYDNTGWNIQSLEKGSLVFAAPSLSVGSNGFPHIVYIIDGAIRYAYQDVNGWTFQTVEEDNQYRSYKSAVVGLDFNDIPRIGYIWSYSGKGGYWSGIIYDGEEIIRNDLDGNYEGLSLDLETNGNPHLIYQGDTPTDSNGGLIYAHKVADSSWSFEVVDNVASRYTSLSVDKQGNPHVSYIDFRSEDIKYAYIPAYLVILSPSIDYHIDFPGSRVLYSLSLHNRGGETDSYSISASGFNWPTTAPASVGPLAGGESTTIDIQVQIPVTATMGMRDTATITVTSQADSSKTSVAEVITLVGKATFLPLVAK